MIDFEIGAINAAAATFEGKEMKGCFFHLCSKLWKQIQRSGLQQRYIDDAEFDNTFEWLRHWHLFYLMKSKIILNNTVIMLETFTMTIAIQSVIILRIPPLVGFVETHLEGRLFLHRHYDEILMKIARTNNSVEGWHRSFQATVAASHHLHSGNLWRNWYRSIAFIVSIFFKFLVVIQHHQCDDRTSMQIKG